MKALCPTCGTEFAIEIPLQENSSWQIAEFIQKVVCEFSNIDMDTLRSKSRKQFICRPRSIAIYLCRLYTDMSLEMIGRMFNRNHSTILYDYQKIVKSIRTGGSIKRQLEFLESKLKDKDLI